ncbi:MAG: WG repeat-containing protein [Aureispira sp.]|nr:WG repeat-containing protein [Aureispira sp.]
MYIKATYTLNIFIAYHPEDQEKFEEVLTHLGDLNKKNKGYLINKVWYDGSDLSESGRSMIHELTEAADIVLLLMSERSILSPFFISKELKDTLRQHHEGASIVIPIILNTCWWEDTTFKNLDVLPRAGLPIYDSSNIKNELFDQVIDELDKKLQIVRHRKQELEESFKGLIQEAESIYKNWEQHPETLRTALPLYKEALQNWREGFLPHRDSIEARIAVCQREIDFRHYANAAHEAYAEKDYQTTYFNCKDALELRNDAVIGKLYKEVSSYLDNEELKILRAPFLKHLEKAHEYFLALRWKSAEEEYHLALEFYEEGFEPTREVIEHKLLICHREHRMEESLRIADNAYNTQNYKQMANVLLDAIKEINAEAFDKIDYAIRLTGYLEKVAPFLDEKITKWGYYNKETKNILIAPKYMAAYSFSENLAGVKKWDKWGFIDIEGNEIIPFEYEFVEHFNNGVAEVIKDKEVFYINHKGQRVDIQTIRMPRNPLQRAQNNKPNNPQLGNGTEDNPSEF